MRNVCVGGGRYTSKCTSTSQTFWGTMAGIYKAINSSFDLHGHSYADNLVEIRHKLQILLLLIYSLDEKERLMLWWI